MGEFVVLLQLATEYYNIIGLQYVNRAKCST
jgi:hypothetical protein